MNNTTVTINDVSTSLEITVGGYPTTTLEIKDQSVSVLTVGYVAPYFENIRSNHKVGAPVHVDNLQQWIDHIYSAGSVDGFELTDNLNGTVDIASGTFIARAVDDSHTTLITLAAEGVLGFALTDNATNIIFAEYDAATPTIGVTINPNDINLTTKVPLHIVVREGNHLTVYELGEDSVDANASLRKRFFYTEKFKRADGGAIVYDTGALHLGCTAGEFWFGLSNFISPALDTTGADVFEYYRLINGEWIESDESVFDSAQYNDITTPGAESLVALGTNKYAVHWIYLIGATINPHYAVVYSQDLYNNLALAELATVPSNIPPSIEGLGILLGRAIVREGSSEIISIQSVFTSTFTASLATSHNDLAELQGGTSGEYYHLTGSEHSGFQAGSFSSNVVDGASAIGFVFNTSNSLENDSAELMSLQNNGVKKFVVNKDGDIILQDFVVAYANSSTAIGSRVDKQTTIHGAYTIGAHIQVEVENSAISFIDALHLEATSTGTDGSSYITGMDCRATHASNSNTQSVKSISARMGTEAGTTGGVSRMNGMVVTSDVFGSGIITDLNGVRIKNMGGASVVNANGIEVAKCEGATSSNHAIHLKGDGEGADICFGSGKDFSVHYESSSLIFDQLAASTNIVEFRVSGVKEGSISSGTTIGKNIIFSASGQGVAGGIFDGFRFENIGTAGDGFRIIDQSLNYLGLKPASIISSGSTFKIGTAAAARLTLTSSVFRPEVASSIDLGSTLHPFSSLFLTGNIDAGSVAGTKIGTTAAQKIGFWNASPVIQPSGTGEAVGFTAGAGTGVNDDSTFTGNIGAAAYRINDIVKALKQSGILAA